MHKKFFYWESNLDFPRIRVKYLSTTELSTTFIYENVKNIDKVTQIFNRNLYIFKWNYNIIRNNRDNINIGT